MPRILAVGGAGTLKVAPGLRNVDCPNFPQQWKGESKISIEDYAMAMFDELERPNHTGRRFTVGY